MFSRSSPIVVCGPWPGVTTVSSGRARSLSCRESMIFSKEPPGRSVRPMLPAKRVFSAINFFSAGKYRQMLPSVCPGVNYICCERACLHRVRLSNALINIHFARRRYANPCGLHVEHLQQLVIILIEQDWCAGCSPQFHGPTHMVDVSMSNDDLLYLQVMLADKRENALDLIAGIDHHGLVRGLVSNDGTVALQRANRKDFVDHRKALCFRPSALSLFSLKG